jgi:hypothetical protein
MAVDLESWSPDAREELTAWKFLLSPTHIRAALRQHLRMQESYEIRGLFQVADDDGGPRPALAITSRSVIDGVACDRGWFIVSDTHGALTVFARATTRLIGDYSLADLVDGWLNGGESRPNGEADKFASGDAGVAQPLANGVHLAANGAGTGAASCRDLLVRASLTHKGENANLSRGQRVRHCFCGLLLALLLRLA